jgi:methionyl-tRNA formyltransferase
MAVTEDGVTVQCIGGRIRLMRVRPAGGDKMPAQEWAAQAGVEKGTVLGS